LFSGIAVSWGFKLWYKYKGQAIEVGDFPLEGELHSHKPTASIISATLKQNESVNIEILKPIPAISSNNNVAGEGDHSPEMVLAFIVPY
jgi:hypothetical protein